MRRIMERLGEIWRALVPGPADGAPPGASPGGRGLALAAPPERVPAYWDTD